MKIDPTILLLSHPPKPSYYCEVCHPRDHLVQSIPYGGYVTTNTYDENQHKINFDLVKDFDDIKTILKALNISFYGDTAKEVNHLLNQYLP